MFSWLNYLNGFNTAFKACSEQHRPFLINKEQDASFECLFLKYIEQWIKQLCESTPKNLFLTLFNAFIGENNLIEWSNLENEKNIMPSFCVKYSVTPILLPGSSVLPCQAALTKSLWVPDFVAFILTPKGHGVPLAQTAQNKWQGQNPGEPVHSAAAQGLRRSENESYNGNFMCFPCYFNLGC